MNNFFIKFAKIGFVYAKRLFSNFSLFLLVLTLQIIQLSLDLNEIREKIRLRLCKKILLFDQLDSLPD